MLYYDTPRCVFNTVNIVEKQKVGTYQDLGILFSITERFS